MKIYLVGGAVRDQLRGIVPSDLDYVIINGDESTLRSRVPGLIRVGQGIPVFLRGNDEYTFSEWKNIEEDLTSRDLTINALAWDEHGELTAHPLALSDLREKILRPVAASNFLKDPLRAVRAARFAAVFSDFTVHDDLLAAMRAVPANALGAVAAERVGQEVLKACAAPRPGNFLRLLSQGECLLPWFAELAEADKLPAGPPQWHDSSILEHTAQIMDRCAGDATATWMALCHDLGKTATPRAELPHHYGHETRGETLADELALRLRLSGRLRTAGRWAARWHMVGAQYATLRHSTLIKLLLGLHKAGIVEPFFRLVEADGGGNRLEQAQRELALLTAVTLPEKHRNLGPKSAEILLQLRCEALARYRKDGGQAKGNITPSQAKSHSPCAHGRNMTHHASRIAHLMDLTNLHPSSTTADIEALCNAAIGPWGQVAGICVLPRLVPFARRKLERAGVRQMEVCTVVNFPQGNADTLAAVREIRSAIGLGATEIDLVFPYRAFLSGNQAETARFLATCRAACHAASLVPLKVILETGVLAKTETIYAASLLALAQGADFLKTSTGRAAIHATPDAARIMFKAVHETGGRAGIKISGGLRRYSDALVYLEMAEEIMGEAWISPRTLRFGASSLLADLLTVMEKPCVGPA